MTTRGAAAAAELAGTARRARQVRRPTTWGCPCRPCARRTRCPRPRPSGWLRRSAGRRWCGRRARCRSLGGAPVAPRARGAAGRPAPARPRRRGGPPRAPRPTATCWSSCPGRARWPGSPGGCATARRDRRPHGRVPAAAPRRSPRAGAGSSCRERAGWRGCPYGPGARPRRPGPSRCPASADRARTAGRRPAGCTGAGRPPTTTGCPRRTRDRLRRPHRFALEACWGAPGGRGLALLARREAGRWPGRCCARYAVRRRRRRPTSPTRCPRPRRRRPRRGQGGRAVRQDRAPRSGEVRGARGRRRAASSAACRSPGSSTPAWSRPAGSDADAGGARHRQRRHLLLPGRPGGNGRRRATTGSAPPRPRPAGVKAWVVLHHEPEDDVARGAFTAAQFKAATAHMAPVIRSAGGIPTTVLMAWTLARRPRAATGATTTRPPSTCSPSTPTTRRSRRRSRATRRRRSSSPPILEVKAATGKDFGLAEFGSPCIATDPTCTQRAAWLSAVGTAMADAGAEFVAYWNRPALTGAADFTLSDAGSVRAWRAALTRSPPDAERTRVRAELRPLPEPAACREAAVRRPGRRPARRAPTDGGPRARSHAAAARRPVRHPHPRAALLRRRAPGRRRGDARARGRGRSRRAPRPSSCRRGRCSARPSSSARSRRSRSWSRAARTTAGRGWPSAAPCSGVASTPRPRCTCGSPARSARTPPAAERPAPDRPRRAPVRTDLRCWRPDLVPPVGFEPTLSVV